MARKSVSKMSPKAAARARDAGENAPETSQFDDAETRVLKALEAEFGTGIDHTFNVKVYKVVDTLQRKGGLVGWLFDWNVEELEDLRGKLAAEEGAGRYRIVVTRDRENWQQYDIEILRDLRPPKPVASAPTAIAPPTGDGMSAFERAFLMMMERQDERARASDERFNLLLERLNAPRGNDVSDMERMASLLKSVRDIAGPENTGLQMFREGIAFAKELIPAGGGEGGLAGVAAAALERLPEILAAAQQQPQPALPAPRQVTQQPIPARAPQRQAAPATNSTPALPAHIAQLKDFLIAKANEAAQPSLFADYTIAQLGDAGLAFLEAQERPLDKLIETFPEIGPHRLWFERLFDAMKDEPADTPAG